MYHFFILSFLFHFYSKTHVCTFLCHYHISFFFYRLCLADSIVQKALSMNNNCNHVKINDSSSSCHDIAIAKLDYDDNNTIDHSSDTKHPRQDQQPKSSKRVTKRRRLKFNNNISNSAEDNNPGTTVGCGDPTKSGRKRKVRRVKKSNNDSETMENDNLVTTTTSSSSDAILSSIHRTKYDQKLEKAFRSSLHGKQCQHSDSTTSDPSCHLCRGMMYSQNNAGYYALDAIQRIITSKFHNKENNKDGMESEDNDDDQMMETEEEDDESNDDEIHDNECTDIEKENMKNPLIFRNVKVRQSGALPFLSLAMTEALEAVVLLVERQNELDQNDENGCKACCTECMTYIQDRVKSLSLILDTLCCLSTENRKIVCCHGLYDDYEQTAETTEPLLICSLLRAMVTISIAPNRHGKINLFKDIGLVSFRTLTSLTHENNIAAAQLMQHIRIESKYGWWPNHNSGSIHGVEVLSLCVFHLATAQNEIRAKNQSNQAISQKHVYDAIVYCLNIITNILETPSSKETRNIVHNLQVQEIDFGKTGNNQSIGMLSWLTRWVVTQTSTFQDVVMMDSIGSDRNNQCNNDHATDIQNELENSQQRDLEHHEDEYLVQAGNGFILLACILVGDNDTKNGGINIMSNGTITSVEQGILETVMNEMPKDTNGKCQGMKLIVNTLKAFCNYYRYSLGDLSVAVVTPVLNLISKLEKINNDIS